MSQILTGGNLNELRQNINKSPLCIKKSMTAFATVYENVILLIVAKFWENCSLLKLEKGNFSKALKLSQALG
jgi:hypothetical protein